MIIIYQKFINFKNLFDYVNMYLNFHLLFYAKITNQMFPITIIY